MIDPNNLQELPKGWVWAMLGDIAETITGTTPPKKDLDNYGNFIPFIKPPELNDCNISHSQDNLSAKGARLARVLPPNSILVSCIGNLGKTGINKIPVAFNQQINAVIFPPEIDSKYGFYFFQTTSEILEKLSSATTVAIVNKSKFNTIIVPIPPFPEQHRIVNKIEKLFTRLDAGVDALKKIQVQIKRYRQSVLKAAFEGQLTAEWRETHKNEMEPASVLLDRVKTERKRKQGSKYRELPAVNTSELPRLTEGWEWTKLDNIAEIKGGITVNKKWEVIGGRKIPYLRVANVQRGYLDLSEIKEIETDEDTIFELLLKQGDVLFNEGGDRDKLGRGWIWQCQIPECIHQNHVFRARLYSSDIQGKLISWFGNTYGQRYFSDEGKQTTNLASVNLTKLSAFPVPIPSPAEQVSMVIEIERHFCIADQIEKSVEASLEQADRLRQSILKQAFEGKLVLQDLTDEPAEKLLERIKVEKHRKSAF